MTEPRCRCGHAASDHPTRHVGLCLGDDLACTCDTFTAAAPLADWSEVKAALGLEAPVTAPVTRVEYAVIDKDGREQDAGADKLMMVEELAYYARKYPIDAPYHIIERTITERVIAPKEEG